ncbi:MAG: hypothetical protein AB7E85_00745 [Pseudobdellovibrionaceae bacterium]
MIKTRLLTFLLLSALFMAACARTTQTSGTSVLDPDYKGQKIRHVLVSAEGMGLSEQRAIEAASVQDFSARGIQAMAGESVFIPTRHYTDAAKRKEAVKSGADYVLTIVATGRKVHHVRTYPDDDFGYGPRVGVGAYGGSSSGVGVGLGFPMGGRRYADEGGFVGGTDFAEPEAAYRAELIRLPDFQRLWIGEFTTRGPDRMSWNRLGEAFAAQLIKKLSDDGLL